MTEAQIFNGILIGFFIIAAGTFVALFLISAPYGRHNRAGWGPQINSIFGWVLMEIPAVLASFICFIIGGRMGNPVVLVFLIMWQVHYLNRTFVFPLRMRASAVQMPLMIAMSGFVFNLFNGYLNGRWINTLGPTYDASWFSDPRFLFGLLLFVSGMYINQSSDNILRNLRKPGEKGYKIPVGGLYRYLSCPNYFGELLEWAGWAIATWSLPGLAFFVWTAANLIPRARTHHRWYQEQFAEYPKNRKAVIPYVF